MNKIDELRKSILYGDTEEFFLKFSIILEEISNYVTMLNDVDLNNYIELINKINSGLNDGDLLLVTDILKYELILIFKSLGGNEDALLQ